MNYVDGFVAAVPNECKQQYIEHVEKAVGAFFEHGALRVMETWGDDVPDGEITSFPLAVKCEEGETVVFSWVEWPSKEVRDAAWQKLEEDERMNPATNPMPFDGKRMIFGGFQSIIDRS